MTALHIDLHTHILPEIDDGSKSVGESIAMLRAEAKDGVRIAVATPHYYPDRETPRAFDRRRGIAAKKLREEMAKSGDLPELRIGAEVYYYPGICRIGREDAGLLRIEGTPLLLVEMPFTDWTEAMAGELTALHERGDTRVVLAHIDRYFSRHNLPLMEELAAHGILFQANTEGMAHLLTAGKLLSFFRRGEIAFLGTDCHGIAERAPDFAKGCAWIEKKAVCDAVASAERQYFGG